METLKTHRDQIRKYEDLADDLGHHPGDVELGWLLAQPAVTTPIIGIFPGHNTAPEDYAW